MILESLCKFNLDLVSINSSSYVLNWGLLAKLRLLDDQVIK